MKRTWIKIHNGLTNDPKHRNAIGVRIWYFMWLCDNADFETGVVYDYTDAKAAQAMEMSARTIEDQRQQLEKAGYISCRARFQSQDIRIMRWRNPREVSPEQINLPGKPTTWYDKPRTHTTETSVPIPAESSVPLHIDHKIKESHKTLIALWENKTGQPAPGAILLDQLAFLLEEYGKQELTAAIEAAVAQRNAGKLRTISVPYVRGILRNGGSSSKPNGVPIFDPYLAKKEVTR